jgi:phosphoglycolate phosphatase
MFTHLLLDFDGTLADSSPGIFQSFLLACEAFGLTPPAELEFRRLIGPPVQHIVEKIYPHLGPDDVERFRLIFRDEYDHRGFRYADWYPGVHDALRVLSDSQNTRLTVVTNKPTSPTVKLLKVAELHSYFNGIIGIDYRVMAGQGSVFSTKAEAIAFALSSTSFESDRQIYLGDTPGDQAAAEACGLIFVAAEYGFYDWTDYQFLPLRINSFSQIIDVLRRRPEVLTN